MKSNQTISEKGRYLYPDYSPFEENKNFLVMLKDFVNLSSSIFQIQNDLLVLHSELINAESMQKDMISRIEQFRSSVEATVNSFHKEYSEKIANARFPLPAITTPDSNDNEGTNLFLTTKSSLIDMLANTKDKYFKRTDEYNQHLRSKITDSKREAIRLLAEWLSNDHYNLPLTLTSNILTKIQVSIDNVPTTKHYTITKTSTISNLQQQQKNQDIKDSSTSGSNSGSIAPSISYSLILSSSRLDFWNYRRKVSEIDVKEILIPFGLRTPITEKIKQSFRIIPGLSKEPIEKEPGFVNVDSYHIVSAALDDKDGTLSVLLANNPLELDYNVIRISYEISELQSEKTSAERYAEGKLPKIDCTIKEGGVQDVLQIKEIAESTNISKIILFGRALIDKMMLLSDPSIWPLRSKLVWIRVDGRDAVSAPIGSDSLSIDSSIHYDPEQVMVFLEAIAKSFTPLVRKFKEKSAVVGELILRYERENGSREEYTVKIEELNSILSATDNGKKISDLLLLSSWDNNASKRGGGTSSTTEVH